MSTLFISDLHLSGERPDIINLFLDFLKETASQTEALYILGDLFEAWIGDDYIEPALDPVIKALRSLNDNSIPVFVMSGNRDFLMGERFELATGCRLINDPIVIDLYGTQTLLMHGDTLCTDDLDYQKLRQQFHDPAWQREFLSSPVEKRLAFAQHAREESKRETSKKASEIMDVNQEAVNNALREHNVTQMIHGHTHRPDTHEFMLDDRVVTRIVLGDWYHQGSVLTCSEEGCILSTIT